MCTRVIEMLAVSLHPYYLSREFTCVILVVVYISLAVAAGKVYDVISSVIAKLQTQHPNAFIAISRDFNYFYLSVTLPTI